MTHCPCPYCTRPGRPAEFTDAEKARRRDYWLSTYDPAKVKNPGRCNRGLHEMTPSNIEWQYWDMGCRPTCITCKTERGRS